jgi:hypothetical protein
MDSIQAGRAYSFCGFGVIGLVFLLLASPVQAQAVPLWKVIQWPGTVTPSPQTIGYQTVEVDIRKLQSAANTQLSLSVPKGTPITVIKIAYENIRKDEFIWHGLVNGDESSVATFAAVGDQLVGDILTPEGRMYRVSFLTKGVHLVEELDPRKFPRESPPLYDKTPTSAEDIQGYLIRTGGEAQVRRVVIDVMVLYTPAAAGSPVLAPARINQAMAETKLSYEKSGVDHRLNLVHAAQIAYTEKSNITADLEALTLNAPDDSEINEVHTWRRAHKADVVVLLTKPVDETDSCGQSRQMQEITVAHCKRAFAVVPMNCATGNYSFAHELGHIMGADHNVEGSTSGGARPYNHGYIQPHPSNRAVKPWRTIMAEKCSNECRRVLKWSNPRVGVVGDAMGDADHADNVRLFNKDTAQVVSKFFPSPQCN